MISKEAVRRFLERDLDNMEWLKEASIEDLEDALLEYSPKFHTPLWKHQKVCYLISTVYSNWMFFADMGLGKTKLLLDILSNQKQNNTYRRALVLVPNVANMDGWVEDASIHSPELKILPLFGSTQERWHMLETEDADAFVINYQGLLYLTTVSSDKKRVIDKDKISFFASHFDFLVADESHKLKSHTSTIYKIVRDISGNYKFRYALTGTPFGRDPHDLWSQFYVIDRGQTLGPTLGIFREAFFTSKKNYWGGYEYKFKSKMEGKLHETMQNRSIYYKAEDCLELPDKIYRKVVTQFPIDSYDYYKNELKKIRDAGNNVKEMENAFIKMRQISSGFLNVKGEDETFVIDFKDNPKLDAILDLIEGIPEDRKIVIFNEFIHSGDLICAELNKKRIKHERLYSGTKDKRAAIRNFKDKRKKIRILVANSASGSTGLNLQVANYVIFYESPVSPQIRQQAEKRCHRAGQQFNKVFYYDMVMKNSIDEKILLFLKEGKDLFRSLIQGEEL